MDAGKLTPCSDGLPVKPLQVDKLLVVSTTDGAASSGDKFSTFSHDKSASKPLMDEMGDVSGSLCGILQTQDGFGAAGQDDGQHMESSRVIGCNGMEPTNGN